MFDIQKSISTTYPKAKFNKINNKILYNKTKNLKESQIASKLYESLKNFNSFLILIKGESDKIFGFFIPHKLEANTTTLT